MEYFMSAQISAYISDETKNKFEAYSTEHGIKKAFLIETALDLYLNVLEEIPSQFIDRQKIVVSNESYNKIEHADQTEPTDALKKLMQHD